jgi:hypothetical protein
VIAMTMEQTMLKREMMMMEKVSVPINTQLGHHHYGKRAGRGKGGWWWW